MNRVSRLLLAFLVLFSCFAMSTRAQTPTPSPAQDPTKAPDKSATKEEEMNPFAPEPATPLPAGMTGSDVNDPRAKLKPGIFDAGEAAMGIRHVLLLKKPDAFQLGSDDPDNPKVKQTLGQLGIGGNDVSKYQRRRN